MIAVEGKRKHGTIQFEYIKEIGLLQCVGYRVGMKFGPRMSTHILSSCCYRMGQELDGVLASRGQAM